MVICMLTPQICMCVCMNVLYGVEKGVKGQRLQVNHVP